jgi:GMP synthase (glutamine-hydrolysing)
LKRALIVRHVPYEGVAGFRQPIEAAGYAIDRVDVADPIFEYLDFRVPDLLVMMGGPMGVYETDAHPWIVRQIEKLAERIQADRPTLGVCLGSQMIAAAMDARVYPGPVKEVGFGPITLTDAGRTSPIAHLNGVNLLHWHGDTFDLPEGAELLASSDAYANQVFRRGTKLLALQCHAEMGEDERFAAWVENLDYIAEAGTTPEALHTDHDRHGAAAVAAGRQMIKDWLAAI